MLALVTKKYLFLVITIFALIETDMVGTLPSIALHFLFPLFLRAHLNIIFILIL